LDYWDVIGKFTNATGALVGFMMIWTFIRRSSVWVLGVTRRKRISNRIRTIELLDELHEDSTKLLSYIAARVFDILAILGAALMLVLLSASGSHGMTVGAVFIAAVGAVIYGMGLAHSTMMTRLRAYETSRATLCRQIERLGGMPPALPKLNK
jgi:hypothetical protein